ncbi:hypothetical protein F4781DRAFT_395966 [Annulohypoxylon bovei var. microspora]|nr:hypothetical protein F4781DRAFT_395966 [Annulohypoxylon bovei var. microspora]
MGRIRISPLGILNGQLLLLCAASSPSRILKRRHDVTRSCRHSAGGESLPHNSRIYAAHLGKGNARSFLFSRSKLSMSRDCLIVEPSQFFITLSST